MLKEADEVIPSLEQLILELKGAVCFMNLNIEHLSAAIGDAGCNVPITLVLPGAPAVRRNGVNGKRFAPD